MTLHLFPAAAPALETLADDLAATPAALATALHVHPRTVARWYAGTVPVPRPVLLALWGVSRWGRSAVMADLAYYGQLQCQRADAMASEVDALRRELARVLSLGSWWGSANEPTLMTLTPRRSAQDVPSDPGQRRDSRAAR